MSDFAINVESLGKAYKIFETKRDKFLHSFGLDKNKKKYIEFWALRNLSITIQKGERVGFIGNNGAGKSTFLKMIAGSVSPTEGIININGEIQALMELGTGFHPEFTGRENIHASLSYQGIKNKDIPAFEKEIIDFSELEEFIDRPFRTYSAGMQARLSFSVATARIPDILIVDEILGAGDAYFAGKSVERMRRITEGAGATVLFVSHDLSSVMQLCNRVVWIDKGEVVMDGDPLIVTKEYVKRVRERENRRLKKREKKSPDSAVSLLYRLFPQSEDTQGISKIRTIELLDKEDPITTISLGHPMDNAEGQEQYVITREGQTSWKETGQDDNGAYRIFHSGAGTMAYGSFQFDQVDDIDLSSLFLHIEANVEDTLLVQYYSHEQDTYITVGLLEPDKDSFSFIAVPKALPQDASPPALDENSSSEKDDYSYGNKNMIIENLLMLNEHGKDTRIFEASRPLQVIIEYNALVEVKNPVFVFCIYLPDGKCASQWFADSESLEKTTFEGKGRVTFSIEKLLLGESSYVCSVGIYESRQKDGKEAESYHVIDRSIYFEIKQPIQVSENLGLTLQPYKVKLSEDNK